MLNTDLFGNVVPNRPQGVPVSVRSNRSKVRVFHNSWDERPPHTLPAPKELKYDPEDNIHPDAIHAGTAKAALSIFRNHVHEYEIDLEHPDVSPVTWGDSEAIMGADADSLEHMKKYKPEDIARGIYRPRVMDFLESMQGKQEGLFENTPADVGRAVVNNTVIPYRNRCEDKGSISYVIPKSTVGGAVRYIGSTRPEDLERGLTGKD